MQIKKSNKQMNRIQQSQTKTSETTKKNEIVMSVLLLMKGIEYLNHLIYAYKWYWFWYYLFILCMYIYIIMKLKSI